MGLGGGFVGTWRSRRVGRGVVGLIPRGVCRLVLVGKIELVVFGRASAGLGVV